MILHLKNEKLRAVVHLQFPLQLGGIHLFEFVYVMEASLASFFEVSFADWLLLKTGVPRSCGLCLCLTQKCWWGLEVMPQMIQHPFAEGSI